MNLSLDISTNAKTKEEYLSKGCQARIRGYLSKARTQLFATRLDALSTNIEKDEKEVSSRSMNSSYNSRRKPRRIIISSVNQSRNRNDRNQNEDLENSDQETWDETDAKLLQNFRGNCSFKRCSRYSL